MRFLEVVLIAILVQQTIAKNNLRDGRQFPVFQVIRFPNDACVSSGTLNGTCYTAEECVERKGSNSGSCANGFGVCCTFSLRCGESNAENNTYLTQTATTTPPMSCTYCIFPSSSTISRVRLDLQTFVIANPRSIPNTVASNAAVLVPPITVATQSGASQASLLAGSSVGDCITDTFVVSGGGRSSPIICGTNTGQHLFVDSDGMSPININFMFGAGGAAGSRQYNIRIQQYDRLNLIGGPQGCLQFYTGDTGILRSFGWQNAGSTHLSSQNYQICIRRNKDKCIICYSETIPFIRGGPTAQAGSFGLSEAKLPATVDATVDSFCSNDYIEIPNGIQSTAAGVAPGVGINTVMVTNLITNDRFCGRCFGGLPAAGFVLCAPAAGVGVTNLQSICTRTTPFRVGVFFNADENLGENPVPGVDDIIGKADFNEASSGVAAAAGLLEPLGTQGFSLDFSQLAC